MDAGETLYSHYKPKLVVHALSAAEAGSGTFTIDPFPNDTVAYSGSVKAEVKTAASGTLRTITRSYFDNTDGTITVDGTSFAEGDIAELLVIKYV